MMSRVYLLLLVLVVACSSNEGEEAKPAPQVEPVMESTDSGAAVDSGAVEQAVEKASEELASASASADSLSSVSCSLGKDERTLASVVKEGGSGCDVQYTKWGEMQVIGGAFHQMEFCNSLIQNVRGNLEASGFSCQ